MIAISDLQNINSIYLNQCITNSIPLVCFIPLSNIKELNNIYKKYDAQIISEISRINFYIDFTLNNFSNMQTDVYLYEVINNNLNTRLYTQVVPITEFQDIAKITVKNLTVLKDKVEDFYKLTRDTLSIYSLASIEAGINFNIEKDKYPSILNFYQGRITLSQITSSIDRILKMNEAKTSNETSLEYSLLDKANSLINISIGNIQQRFDLNALLEQYLDYYLVALITYEEYNFTTQDQIDIFFNRPYNIIRLDIIKALKNHL